MSDVNAALGLAQLRKLDRFHAIRSYYATVYRLGLDDLPELMLPRATEDGRHAWRLFMVELDLDRLTIDRNRFVGLLRDEDIGAGVPPRPLHLQSRYVGAFDPRNFPNALRLWSRAMSLPLYPRMTEGDVWRVISVIRRIVDRYRAFDAFRAHG
jgi:dTDP-4-amino-4,6-dideoxygalactose transaminase